MWIDLESVIQREISQKEKQIYYRTYMESRKMGLMNLSAGQEQRHRQIMDLWTQWGKETV